MKEKGIRKELRGANTPTAIICAVIDELGLLVFCLAWLVVSRDIGYNCLTPE